MSTKTALKPRKMIGISVLFVLLGAVSILLTQVQTRQNTQTEAAGECIVSNERLEIKSEEDALFQLINQYRTENGLAVLTWSNELKRPAAWLSNNMLMTKVLSHTDSLGRTTAVRLPDCGFPLITNYAENIAQGVPNANDIIAAWKASSAHNQILLNPNYKQVGIAMEIDPSNQENSFWTMDIAGAIPSTTPGVSVTIQPTGITPGAITVTPEVTTDPNNPQPTNPAGEEVPTPTLGPGTVNMQIFAKVKIQGIGKDGNATPKNRTRKITAAVFDTTNKQVNTGSGFLTYDGQEYFTGNIQLGRMTQGIYFVRMIGEGTLSQLVKPEFRLLKSTEVNELPPVMLIQGDVVKDNILNLSDFNAALSCFQNKRCDSQEVIDFNDDGNTDVTDYNLLLKSFTTLQGN